MKRFFFFGVWVMLFFGAVAQPAMPTFRFGEANKGVDYLMAHNSRIISSQGGEILIATWETRSLLKAIVPYGLQVLAVDTNMKVLRQVSLPDTRMSELVFANQVEGKVYLMYRGKHGGEYHRAVIDPQSMTLESCERVFDSLQWTFHWTAKSDNGLFYALADVFYHPVSKEVGYRQVLLDEKLEVLWEKRFETNLMSNLLVSDDGEVYLFGSRYDKNSHETTVAVHMLDVDDEWSVEGRVSIGEVYGLTLLNIVGGKAVAAGYIRSSESPKKKDYFDQMVGMAIDIRTGDLKAEAVGFTSDELNVFGNRNTRKQYKEGMVDALVMMNSVETNYGGVLLLQRRWKVTTRSTSSPDLHTYFSMGSLALAVDTTGTIIWHKPFRDFTVERTVEGRDFPAYDDPLMFSEGDNVYLLLPESSKSPATYDISSPAAKVMVGNKPHACAVYGIDRQGTVAKQVPVRKDSGSMMDNWVRLAPGKYLGIFSYSKKSALIYANL